MMNSNDVIERGNYRGVGFVIRKFGNAFVGEHFCAYFYSLRVISEGDYIASQEITFSSPVAKVPWADSVEFEGCDVIGWDYNHSYNCRAAIDDVRRDVCEVIDEYLDVIIPNDEKK